ncbi:DNA primase [Sediminibacterium salmoneum]|uniref:DNA primase n=1 Tax=Sediminibacterium salmoneum TaxID=426421 RepID=UPI00047A00E0|nr:DNA primase [Sediminibacterium salmoneum]
MISEQTKQQITSRIDIIDVIGEFVKLKKRGTNYLGLCPFHGEKSPSFTVSPVKEIYKCFGCGKSGNTITFLMEHEKYSYVEALKWLAHRYNVEIEETQRTPEQVQQQQVSESLHAINTFAQKFFTEQLFHSEEGQMIAGSYLKERGFREEVLQKFQIGYNPSTKDALTAALLQNQFNKDLLPKTGLVAFRNEELVDNYRGRIIFPIHNNTGKIIGFGARVIGKADKAPKYINTPENEVYSKSKILYGSYFARQAIDKAKECLLVEGYTDVVSLHQAGIENVVASGGTSLTIDQLRLIKKYTNNLTIIYDGDAAGIKAALRGLDLAVEEGLDVKLVLIPDGEDPDSYVNKVGATAFNAFIAASKKDFILFQLEVLLKEAGNDINKKSGIVNQIAETLSKISRAEDFTRQQDYIKQCASLLKIDEAGFTNLVNKFKRDKIAKEEKKLPFEEADFIHQDSMQPNRDIDEGQLLLQQDDQVEKNVVRVLYEYGLKPYDETRTIAAYIFEELENYPIENPTYEKLIDLYKEAYNKGLEPTTKTMLYHDDSSIRELLINISLFPFELSNRWDEILPNMNIVNKDVSIPDTEMSLNYFKLRKIKKMFEQNQRDMETASFEEQLKLIELHKQLKEFEIAITKQLGTVILR